MNYSFTKSSLLTNADEDEVATKTHHSNTSSKRKVLLEQEYPDYDIILQRAEASLTESDTPKGCCHLRELLPHTLSLELAQSTTTPNQWWFQDPIHALHFTSQYSDNEEFRTLRDMPMLYGEEQERRIVLQMRGFTDVHHPYTHDWNELHQQERDSEEAMVEDVAEGVTTTATTMVATSVTPTEQLTPRLSNMAPPLPRPSNLVESAQKDEPGEHTTMGVDDVPVVDPIRNDSLSQTESVRLETIPTNNPTPVVSLLPQEKIESSHSDHAEIVQEETKDLSQSPDMIGSAKVEVHDTVQSDLSLQQPSSPVTTTPITTTIVAESPVAQVQDTTVSTSPVFHYKSPERLLDENRYWSLHTQESHIEKLRSAFLSKRMGDTTSSKKKRKSDSKPMVLQYMMAWRDHRPYLHKIHDISAYRAQQERARRQTQLWMEQYRRNRVTYWQRKTKPKMLLFGAMEEDNNSISFPGRQCYECRTEECLMQCLECSVVACGPERMKHMLNHNLETNHNFAVTCDRQAKVYCFACGQYVEHDIFDSEKERIDLSINLPWLSWKEHPVLRSFDAYRFLQIPDQGIFWRGMYATYPSSVPAWHVRGARACRRRQIMFHGEIETLSSDVPEWTLHFVQEQQRLGPRKRYNISAPVGMYNLGNTCYQSSVLQCLMACPPVQKYFLDDFGHPFATCQEHRLNDSSTVCIACAMDRLMLQYFGSARGVNALALLEEQDDVSQLQGDPLVGSEMLYTTWKCPGMTHLAGYEQRDAHEFLHGFLDSLSKSDNEFHSRIRQVLGRTEIGDKTKEVGLVKHLFDGSFRSVLICQECHNKRSQTESFMSISLPLSKEVERTQTKLSVESCLRSFTTPETLTDPVDCPICRKKTSTKQQHVIRRLPRLLVLHLKRFDNSRKVEDLVSFPEHDLNMGIFLPHWCEARQVETTNEDNDTNTNDDDDDGVIPNISYELVGTVNHYGSLTSGHYTSSVKIQNQWYSINDQHVSRCDAKQVLENEASYLLYYFRK